MGPGRAGAEPGGRAPWRRTSAGYSPMARPGVAPGTSCARRRPTSSRSSTPPGGVRARRRARLGRGRRLGAGAWHPDRVRTLTALLRAASDGDDPVAPDQRAGPALVLHGPVPAALPARGVLLLAGGAARPALDAPARRPARATSSTTTSPGCGSRARSPGALGWYRALPWSCRRPGRERARAHPARVEYRRPVPRPHRHGGHASISAARLPARDPRGRHPLAPRAAADQRRRTGHRARPNQLASASSSPAGSRLPPTPHARRAGSARPRERRPHRSPAAPTAVVRGVHQLHPIPPRPRSTLPGAPRSSSTGRASCRRVNTRSGPSAVTRSRSGMRRPSSGCPSPRS